jgi:hypothetical protein
MKSNDKAENINWKAIIDVANLRKVQVSVTIWHNAQLFFFRHHWEP